MSYNSVAAITMAFIARAKEGEDVNNDVLKSLGEAKFSLEWPVVQSNPM